MYLRHVFLHWKSIVSIRLPVVNRLIVRNLSTNTQSDKLQLSYIKKSADEEQDGDDNDESVKAIVETEATRKAREKAEWERLSFVERFVKKYFPSQINSIAIFVVLGVSYVIYEQIKNDYEIKHSLRHGSCPNYKFKEEQFLKRQSLLNSLIKMVTPIEEKLVSSYYIVLGEHGTGKSTLVRQAARIAGRGVIYVDVPANTEKFGIAFANAIRFNFKDHIRLSTWIESKMFGSPPDEGEGASWERVLYTFQKYAIAFRKKYGIVPVLIFDNCDLLAQKHPEMLEILQDTAKNAIDDCLWITVFVTSVGIAPEQMEGRSSITRASSFFEIPDLSKDEAMIYLIEKRNIEKDLAEELYALFGGRIKSLQNAVSKLESGVDFATIRSRTLQDISRRIEKIKCRISTNEQIFLTNILCHLLTKSELIVDELIEMENDVNIRQKILEQLRNETILIRSVSNGSYVYHSQAIKIAMEEYYQHKCRSCI